LFRRKVKANIHTFRNFKSKGYVFFNLLEEKRIEKRLSKHFRSREEQAEVYQNFQARRGTKCGSLNISGTKMNIQRCSSFLGSKRKE
jgi:hypothetical protein